MLISQAITARAMNNELDFSESLRARVALLKGTPDDVYEKVKSVITLTPGAKDLCKGLKRLGYKIAVLSGGFTPLVEWIAKDLGIDYAYANNVSKLCVIFLKCPEFTRAFVLNRSTNHLCEV
jgi:phosphoserine phosphatase